MKIALFALLIAATMPSVASAQFFPEDYPPAALRHNEEGRTFYLLQYGADGRATSCAVIRSSGYNDLDVTACRLLKARGRFKPGRSGEKAGFVDWRIPRDPAPVSTDQSEAPPRSSYSSERSNAAYEAGKARAAAAMAASYPR